jgi:hypothetical protein
MAETVMAEGGALAKAQSPWEKEHEPFHEVMMETVSLLHQTAWKGKSV